MRGDLDAAIKSNTAYLKIHALAADDREVFQKYNRFAEFWSLCTYALQTTFFVSLGRIFDPRRDTLSIHKLVKATVDNHVFFSKEALRELKRRQSHPTNSELPWLEDFVSNAWEPKAGDLDFIQAALKPHADKFTVIYQPIRHKVYAHKSTGDDAAISVLFAKTRVADITEILCFLDTLVEGIRHMAWNGVRPDLSNFAHYKQFVKQLDAEIEAFVRQLP